jgi:group I intron endonuclease
MLSSESFSAHARVVQESEWPVYRKVSGVYAIRSTASGKFYVGSAVDIYGRWRSHKSKLDAGKNRNMHFQRAWSKYGIVGFEFFVLEICAREHAVPMEQVWLDWTQAVARGYNLAPVAGSNLGTRFSPQARANMAASSKGRKVSFETRARIAATTAGREPNPETLAKARLKNTGRKNSAESIEVMRARKLGKKNSAETLAKRYARSPVSVDMAKEIQARYAFRCPVNGAVAMAKEFGISEMTVLNVIKGKHWTLRNFAESEKAA